MQTRGTKLIFVMNFSVLDFFKFASRMPQIADFSLDFQIFWWGGHAPGPLTPYKLPLFFFHLQFQALNYVGLFQSRFCSNLGCHPQCRSVYMGVFLCQMINFGESELYSKHVRLDDIEKNLKLCWTVPVSVLLQPWPAVLRAEGSHTHRP